jgi:hypothetical protein
VGVSIPFLISAIHNGVRTKDRKVGAPVRTNLDTENRPRTVTTPLANAPVVVTLPNGTAINATSDGSGRVTTTLPDTTDAYFPLKVIATVKVPSKEATYEIPATAETLTMLPPSAKARADALAEEVRRAAMRYETVAGEFRGPLEELQEQEKQCLRYTIRGDIIETKEQMLILKGSAYIARTPLGESEQGEGTIYDAYIAVFNYNPNTAKFFGYKRYEGEHYFRGKFFEKLYLKQTGPIMMYGDLSDDQQRRLEAAQRKIAPFQAKLNQARAEKDAAWTNYFTALPTNPYGLKK